MLDVEYRIVKLFLASLFLFCIFKYPVSCVCFFPPRSYLKYFIIDPCPLFLFKTAVVVIQVVSLHRFGLCLFLCSALPQCA